MLMFVNGLDSVVIGHIYEENLKFCCSYARGGKLQEYSYHTKTGFPTYVDTMRWFYEMFPDGNMMSQENFLHVQHQLLMLKIPTPGHYELDPLHMRGLDSVGPKRTKEGKLESEFE